MVKIELNQDEIKVLLGLIDAGIRSTGIQSVKGATAIILKLENAKPVEAEPEPAEE